MTALLAPFTGFAPAAEVAHRIVGPPSAVLSPGAPEAARRDPLSFRHAVGRGAAPTRKAARRWVRSCVNQGALRPVGPAVLAYRQTKADLVATGLIAEVSTAAYDSDAVIDRLGSDHLLEEPSEANPRPRAPRELGDRIGGRSYRLRIHPDRVPDDPKSTWFAPKLPAGLVIRLLDG